MSKLSCLKCATTGVLFAGLVKDPENHNNLGISVVLCDHFDNATEATMNALATTGLPVSVKTAEPVVVVETPVANLAPSD